MTAGDIGLVYPSLPLQHLILVAFLSLSVHHTSVRHTSILPPTIFSVYESLEYLISTHHFHSAVTLDPFISASYMKANGGNQFWLLWSSLSLKASNCPFRLLRHCSWASPVVHSDYKTLAIYAGDARSFRWRHPRLLEKQSVNSHHSRRHCSSLSFAASTASDTSSLISLSIPSHRRHAFGGIPFRPQQYFPCMKASSI